MIRLLGVELRRYLHRRAVLVLLLGCVGAPFLLGLITVLNTTPPSDSDLAYAQTQVERDRQNPDYQEQVDYCIENPQEWGIPTGASAVEIEEQCRLQNEPQLEWYLDSNRLDLDSERGNSGVAVASLVAILLLLAGTTFTGHDWASGSVSNQLLFEPRRSRVWTAKALVVTGAALIVAGVVMSAYWAVLGLVAQSRDVLDDGQMLDALQMGWRTAFVAAGAALLGFTMTTLFRSTVATIGILLGASVAGSLLLAGIGISERWSPALNLAALIDNGTSYYDADACDAADDVDAYGGSGGDVYYSCEEEITFTDASLYVGTLVLVAGVASFVSFRRRDVP